MALIGGLFLHTPADDHTTTGCAQWDEWENYTPTQKANLMTFAMASMDGLQVLLTFELSISSCLLTRSISTSSSGRGRLARALQPAPPGRLSGRTSLDLTMDGFPPTRGWPLYVPIPFDFASLA
jgi:hypothetical protein